MRFEITIDCDPNTDPASTLANLATDAGATFTDITVCDAGGPAFAYDVTLAFTASVRSVARYGDFYDCDDTTITLL